MDNRIYYPQIRRAGNADSQPVIQLIDSVLAEWNDAVCLEGSEKDLLDLDGSYWSQQGAFVVLETEQKIVGSHGILPIDLDAGLCTFKRLYLHPDYRGTSAGTELMQWNIDWVRQNGFQKVEFWSDTRFHRAHRFFEKMGFQKSGEKREMHDSHETYWEYYFSMPL